MRSQVFARDLEDETPDLAASRFVGNLDQLGALRRRWIRLRPVREWPCDLEIVNAGIAALGRYIDSVERVGLERVPPAELLLYRSAKTLSDRLTWSVQSGSPVTASILSPADIWTLDDLAKSEPHGCDAMIALRDCLKRVL